MALTNVLAFFEELSYDGEIVPINLGTTFCHIRYSGEGEKKMKKIVYLLTFYNPEYYNSILVVSEFKKT